MVILNIDKPLFCFQCMFLKTCYTNGGTGLTPVCSITKHEVYETPSDCPLKPVYIEEIKKEDGEVIRVLTVREND